MPAFVIHMPGEPASIFRFASTKLRVGRSSKADFRLRDDSISRKHALIREKAGRFLIKCYGQNTVYKNGRPLQSVLELQNGDLLQMGPYIMHFHTEDPEDVLTIGGPKFKDWEMGRYQAWDAAQTNHISASDMADLRERVLSEHRATLRSEQSGKGIRLKKRTVQFGEPGVTVHGVMGSGPHAKVEWDGDGHVLRKLGWLASVKVNGVKVRDAVILRSEDRIEVGRSRFRYVVD